MASSCEGRSANRRRARAAIRCTSARDACQWYCRYEADGLARQGAFPCIKQETRKRQAKLEMENKNLATRRFGVFKAWASTSWRVSIQQPRSGMLRRRHHPSFRHRNRPYRRALSIRNQRRGSNQYRLHHPLVPAPCRRQKIIES